MPNCPCPPCAPTTIPPARHQALTTRPEGISTETLTLGATGKHHVAATIVLAAPDTDAADLMARQAIQQACAIARLPTEPLRAITTEPLHRPPAAPAT